MLFILFTVLIYLSHPRLRLGWLFRLGLLPPDKNDDLSDRQDLANSSASICATNDAFTTQEGIERTQHLLPPNTVIHAIEGGNHSQFGDYGFQSGDGTATITQDEQLQIITEKTLEPMVKSKVKPKKSKQKVKEPK